MKKLFALLFSFQLIVSPVFAADAAPTPGTEEDAYLETGTGGKGKKGGYDFYVAQIGALATSAVGTSIITSCTTAMKNPSLMILFGGSVVHIASELLGAKASNEDHTMRMKDLKIKEEELKLTGDSAQKAALEQRLVEEKATLKFLKNRTMWMTAVTTVYATALGVAIWENIVHYIPPTPATPNMFFQYFDGACNNSETGIPWGTVISAAYGMGTSKIGSGGAVSTYGTMLITLLNFAVPAMSKTIGKLYSQPIPRVVTIGVALALAGTVTSGLIVRTGIAKDNIKKLEKVIAQFKENSEGAPTGVETGVADGSDEIKDNIKIKSSLKPMVEIKKKQCISLAGGKADISEAACAKKLNITKTNFPSEFNLPAMNNVNGLSADMVNALASGDEARAAQLAGDIGAYAARVQKESDALTKKYNEIQKKNNKPDLETSVKAQVASLQGTLNQGAAANKIDLASAAAANKLDEDSVPAADAPVVTTAAPTPAVEIPVDPLAGLGGTEEMTLPEVKTAAAQNLDDFESTEEDISKKPETSIFKQLSNRYILNYTKMFEPKKSLDTAKPAPTN